MAQVQPVSQVSSPFIFQDHQIRTVIENDQLWFAAKDVCSALDIKWNGKASLVAIPADWQGVGKLHTPRGGVQAVMIISEPAVYKLAFRSNKPDADEFTNWIAGEVVPAIRKTGKYDIQEQPALSSTITPSRLSTAADTERKALNKLVKVWAHMLLGGKIDPGVWPRVNTQVAAHFGKTSVDEMTIEEIREAINWVQGKIDTAQAPKALPEAKPQPTIWRMLPDADREGIRERILEMRRQWDKDIEQYLMFLRYQVAGTNPPQEHFLLTARSSLAQIHYLLDGLEHIGFGMLHLDRHLNP